MISSDKHECFALQFHDRFGEYGTVGFAAAQLNNPDIKLIEMAISCRVVKRQVEQTFICWLAKHYYDRGFTNLVILMRRTGKNDLLMNTFEGLPFRKELLPDNIIKWTLPLKPPLPVYDIITVQEK